MAELNPVLTINEYSCLLCQCEIKENEESCKFETKGWESLKVQAKSWEDIAIPNLSLEGRFAGIRTVS